MNKKAVIGTTMTWVVALGILIFIMILFLTLVSYIGISMEKNSFPSDEPDIFKQSKINSLIGFFQINEKEISSWADDGIVLSPIDIDPFKIPDDPADIQAVANFQILCRKMTKFSEYVDMNGMQLCLEADSEKGLKTIYIDSELECSISSCVKDGKVKMFFISENGNNIRAYYSDETNFKLKDETKDVD